jgi:hypothetical protein
LSYFSVLLLKEWNILNSLFMFQPSLVFIIFVLLRLWFLVWQFCIDKVWLLTLKRRLNNMYFMKDVEVKKKSVQLNMESEKWKRVSY